MTHSVCEKALSALDSIYQLTSFYDEVRGTVTVPDMVIIAAGFGIHMPRPLLKNVDAIYTYLIILAFFPGDESHWLNVFEMVDHLGKDGISIGGFNLLPLATLSRGSWEFIPFKLMDMNLGGWYDLVEYV